ncbi:MAG: amino acid adenylation domain-containing protein, partial [Saprospiraceae bacterium]
MSVKQNKSTFSESKATIVDWFEQQVLLTPEAIALVFEGEKLTYHTLNTKANQLAHHLLQYKLDREALVAICVERSVEMIIGILGILKAGAAYVPLSPETPKERLAWMLSDTQARIVLSQSQLLASLPNPTNAKIICLDQDWSETISKESDQRPEIAIHPEHLSYTIYTSGSTGKPKGVLIEHRNVVNLVQGHLDRFQLPVERFLYAYSFAFDGSVLLIFQTLLQGATLVIAPEHLEKDIKQLAAFIEDHQISNLLSFPSLYALLLEQSNLKQLKSLKSVNLAGEALPGALVTQHQQLLPTCRIVNQYGPTEATVGTTVFIVPPNFQAAKVPIGNCIDYTEVFILNEKLEQVPIGTIGEIYIGGKGVARGYLNRPQLTAERFIPHPFQEDKTKRLYRTGDLAQWLPDGNLDFIGRTDHQVKLRGYRIELGEIEVVLAQHEAVREAITIITDAPAADQKLVAYIVLKKNAQLNTTELRAYLEKHLPAYMVPALFIFLDQMPLANSGKVDRKALPKPSTQRPTLKQSYVAPVTTLEKFLSQLWCDILALDQIGTQDKFFELGGNSLQAAKFINIVQETLGEPIFIITIFDAPTIASYAAMLEKDYPEAIRKNFSSDTATRKESTVKAKSIKLQTKDFTNFANLVPRFQANPKVKNKKNPRAIFILAPPRSGTTLLRVMLAGHPAIFAANELQLLGFNTLQERNDAYQNKFSLWQEGLLRTIMEIKSIDAHAAKTVVQSFAEQGYTCQQVYQTLQDWIGDKILVDKSPSYATDLAVLQHAEEIFDNAIYIHLVRHPYAMISSFAKMHMDQVMYLHPHNYTPKALGELIWTESHRNILNFLENVPANRQFRLSYETLVEDPQTMMEQLCETVGLPFHPNLLTPYKDLNKKMTDGIYADSKPMGDIRLLQHKKINPALAQSWKGVLADNFISASTWKLATQLNYQQPPSVNTTAEEKSQATPEVDTSADIAIIGMSGRFAGAKNLDAFWKNIISQKDVSETFTAETLQAEGVDPSVLNDPNYVNRGMPLEDAACFDASFFGYLPKEAALMDPQHRIFLECAYEAMEDTGYNPEHYQGTIGIFGGVARNTYLVNNVMTHPQYFKSVDDFMLGITLEKDFPATRVAYKLNLKGPAVNIQTACSSSGVAVHLACQSILMGDSDMVLVGGGRIQPPIYAGHFHKEGHALSPDGYCRAFDADAQGMVRGNGMAFIALKKLSQAIADGDTIHAVIKGTAINNDGSDKIGFTAPSIKGQTSAISKAYQKAGINPETLGYLEAHGTGTRIGDPIEIAGLTKAFQQFTDKKEFCAIGSVKTNIGHLDAGASIAGIIKTVLALKHRVLPPIMHFKKANPQIQFEKTPFYVNHQLRNWEAKDTPRRAGISSFGLGGTNAHIILEEAPAIATPSVKRSHQLLVLSAKTEMALEQATSRLGKYLDKNPTLDLHHVATTLQRGRKHFQHRKIIVASSLTEAADALSKNDQRKLLAKVTENARSKVVFMFPGGGAQHSNMGWSLYQQEPIFRATVDQCLTILKEQHQLDLRDNLYPPRTEQAPLEHIPITDPLHAITLLFTIEYATAQLWLSWGIVPSEMIGHSLGEYTAACVAGVISLEDSLALVAKRGQLFKTLPEGTMLSIPLSAAAVKPYMDETLSFAAINKPDQCVVSGSVAAIDRIKEKLTKAAIHAPRLHISVAAHSLMVEPILEEFEAFLKTIPYQEASIPIVSNVTGDWVKPGEIQQASYWVKHLRQTVKFSDGISQVFGLSERFLLEIGPGQTLSTFARQHPQKPAGQLILASLKHPKEKTDDLAFILKTLGQLWLSGMEIDWSLFAAHLPFQRTSLPPYPFEKKRFWIEAKRTALKNNDLEPIASTVKQTTMNAPEVQRKNLVTRDLKDIFHQLSGMSVEELGDYTSFLELGFDSLFLTQAIGKLKKKFDVKLSFRQLFDDLPTIDTLSEYIDGQLPSTAYETELNAARATAQDETPVVTNIVATPMANGISPTTQPTYAPPVVSNTMPPAAPGSVQAIINQQLHLMQQQLSLLSGGQLQAPTNIPAPQITPNEPTPVQKTVAKTTTANPPTAQTKLADAGKKHGPWRPIDKKDNDGLTPQQRKYLTEFIQNYTTRTKSSQALIAKQRPRYADPRSITSFNKIWKDMVYQIAIDRSKGSKIWDLDGNEYVDYVMAFGISLMGHTPDFIQTAVQEQLAKGIELGVLTPLAHQVAELLCELTGMERVTFVNTGSEALAAAVRSARTVTGKDKIIVFEGDYHGISDELLARAIQRNGKSVTMPVSPGIPLSLMQNVMVLNYDDPKLLTIIEENAEDLAAILIEPVQPMNPHLQRKALFHQIRTITSQQDIALIFDEMITGFRVAPGGAQEWFDIEVDLVCYGKILSGGLPMAALAGKSKYLDVFDGGMWQFGDDSIPEAGVTFFGGTFVKHPLCLASAYAALTEIKRRGPELYHELNEKTRRFAERLRQLFLATKVPLRIYSTASVFSIQVVDDNPIARLFYFYLRAKGVHLTERAGLVSTAHSEEDLDFTYRMIEEIIKEMQTASFFKITLAEVEDHNQIVPSPLLPTLNEESVQKVFSIEKKKIP